MSALIRALLSAASVQLQPGDKADLTLTVQNMSEIVDRFTIAVEGVDPAWVKVSRVKISLFPKDQDQVRIFLQPPAGPAARAGRYVMRIQVRSQENAAERTTVSCELEIAASAAFELAMRPQRASGPNEGTFALQITNTGNADLAVLLSASDPEEGCLFSFHPPQVPVPAGEARLAQLLVRPRSAQPSRQSKVYSFTVVARMVGAPQVGRFVNGQWEQLAPPRRPIVPILVATLGGLAAVAVLLTLFLWRPWVHAAAPTATPTRGTVAGPSTGPPIPTPTRRPTETPRPRPTHTPTRRPTATPMPVTRYLFRVEIGAAGTEYMLIPDLASPLNVNSEMVVENDGAVIYHLLVCTFDLTPGVEMYDGRPFTARVVQEMLDGNPIPSYRESGVVDDYTVRVVLFPGGGGVGAQISSLSELAEVPFLVRP